MKPGEELETIQSLQEKIKSLSGLFPKILSEELTRAESAGDVAWAQKVLLSAEKLPSRWLAREYFKW